MVVTFIAPQCINAQAMCNELIAYIPSTNPMQANFMCGKKILIEGV